MTHPETRGRARTLRALRWTARVWSVVSIAVIIMFFIGEGFGGEGFGAGSFKPGEWAGFAFFPIGVCAGMVISWRREAAGGSVTVLSMIAFYILGYFTSGRFPSGWAWLAFSAPGFLFLFIWCLSPRGAFSHGTGA
jgi:hypothetical protein